MFILFDLKVFIHAPTLQKHTTQIFLFFCRLLPHLLLFLKFVRLILFFSVGDIIVLMLISEFFFAIKTVKKFLYIRDIYVL